MTSIFKRLTRRQLAVIALLALVTAASAGLSLYFAVNRLDGYNYRLADYATIYVPQEAFSVVGVSTKKGAVTLHITGELGDGELEGPAGSAMELVGENLHLTGVPGGVHAFRIASPTRPDLRRDFLISGRGHTAQVTSSSVLIGRFDRKPLKQLATPLEDYDNDDIERATAKLAEHAVVAGASSLDTLKNLWNWLYPEMAPRRGHPPDPDWLRNLPAYAQYDALAEGRATGHCVHMAEVHNLFGTVAGLAMRVIAVNGRLDKVNIADHTFNEIWIPEQERWAYSDLQTGVLFVRDSQSNNVVNAVQLCQLAQAGATASLVATKYDLETMSVVDVPYDETSTPRLLNSNATFVYHRYYPNRVSMTSWLDRSIINPELAFMMQAQNSKHLQKIIALGILAACIAAWCLLATRFLRHRRVIA